MIVEPGSIEFDSASGFLVIEGINGAGKSTISKSLALAFEAAGFACLRTFEPGSTPQGKLIREMVLVQDQADKKLTNLAELFLFCADRNLHVQQVIRPALNAGKVVLCDRYFYSTLAFQGYGRGMSLELIESLSISAIEGCIPDAVIVLDMDPQAALERTKSRGGIDSFEQEDIDFHKRLRLGFKTMAKNRPEHFLMINADQAPEAVRSDIEPFMQRYIAALKKARHV